MTIEEYALKLYPNPIMGNSRDSEDFELRSYKALIQRIAFVRGFNQGRKAVEDSVKTMLDHTLNKQAFE